MTPPPRCRRCVAVLLGGLGAVVRYRERNRNGGEEPSRLRFAHTLTATADGRTAITITVSFHGLLRPLFERVIGKDIARDLAGQIERLARAAEAEEAADAGTAKMSA